MRHLRIFVCAQTESYPAHGETPGTKKNSNAAFVQRRFAAKTTYVDMNAYMDIQAIHLFDASSFRLWLLLLLLMEKEGMV